MPKLGRVVNITILHTLKCNLNCSFCYLGEENLNSKKIGWEKLSTNEFKEKVDMLFFESRLSNIGDFYYDINFTGGDATLDYGFFKKFFDSCIDGGYMSFIGSLRIYTNGILAENFIYKINKEYSILSKKIEFCFSIAGFLDVHDSIVEHKGAFLKVVKSVQYSLNLGFETRITALLTTKSLNSTNSMLELLLRMGCKKITLFLINNMGNAYKNSSLIINFLDEDVKYKMIKLLDFCYQKQEQFGTLFYLDLPECITLNHKIKNTGNSGIDVESNFISRDYYYDSEFYTKKYTGFTSNEMLPFSQCLQGISIYKFYEHTIYGNEPEVCKSCKYNKNCSFLSAGENLFIERIYGVKIKGSHYFDTVSNNKIG